MKIGRLNGFIKPAIISLFALAVISLALFIYNSLKNEKLFPKVFRIAIDQSWYPLELYNKKEALLVFSEDLMQEIAKKEKINLELLQVVPEDLFIGLDEGEYEGVLSSLMVLEKNSLNYVITTSANTITSHIGREEGSESYIFSKPYYLLGPVLVVPMSSSIKSLNDLNKKRIGVIKGDKLISNLSNNSSIRFVFYDDSDRDKLSNDVVNQEIDGMILDDISAYQFTTSPLYQDKLRIASAPLTREGLRLIVKNNPESKELIDKFNEGLKTLKKDGAYNQLLLKWDLFIPDSS